MNATAALTIWVAASQAAAPSTNAMSGAASEMLGAVARVRTEVFPDERPEAVPTPEAGEESATLAWDSPRHEHARLRICRAADDCLERWVTFEPTDPEAERGRTLGFLIASIVLSDSASPTPAALHVPTLPLVPEAPAPLAPARPNVNVPAGDSVHAGDGAHAPRRFPRGDLTVAATATGPGDGAALGASLGADFAQSQRLRIGVAGELRFGELGRAQASSRVASLLVRASYVLFEPAASTWLGVSGDAGVYRVSASHFSPDDREPDRQGRFLLGGTFGAIGGVDFNTTSTLYLELGAEILSGKTAIYVQREERAAWPVANALARIGLRSAF